MPICLRQISTRRSERQVSRGGAVASEKNSRGSGSKVSTAGSTESARASATTRSRIAAWPRCTPSKLPMAIAVRGPPLLGWRTIRTALLVAREVAHAKSHHREGPEVGERCAPDHERELDRALRGAHREPRAFAAHAVPEDAAHEIERDRDLEEERGPSRLGAKHAGSAHQPPEPRRVEARAERDGEREARVAEPRHESDIEELRNGKRCDRDLHGRADILV